ncbi:MAG: 2-C-methyl-D-erythritol 4-phosphate cytidylyltransferase [Andreesenia angusta]|nr:2-C-methyl-D-erythritol 4-phosphate cytidylyltransferase [Andreesenia angusta]
MNNKKRVAVIIVAAGVGKRMGRGIAKQYLELKEEPILLHTLRKFDLPEIDEIIVVIKKEDKDLFESRILNKIDFKIKTVYGGKERIDSVRNGMESLSNNIDIVLIHDGVRPFVSKDIIRENIIVAREKGAALTAVKSKDTVKIVEKDLVANTPNREKIYLAQTPQSFKKDILIRAYDELESSEGITDDSMVVERLGEKIYIVQGNYDNIKITTEEDLFIGERILEKNGI